MVGTNYQQLHRLLNLYEIEGPTAVAVINLVYELLCVTLGCFGATGVRRILDEFECIVDSLLQDVDLLLQFLHLFALLA